MTPGGTIRGGLSRPEPTPLLNAHEVPPGVHHDATHPRPVTVTLPWPTGDETFNTWAMESTDAVVRYGSPTRVIVGAVWLPVKDVQRR